MLVLCGLARASGSVTRPTVAARQADATDADLERRAPAARSISVRHPAAGASPSGAPRGVRGACHRRRRRAECSRSHAAGAGDRHPDLCRGQTRVATLATGSTCATAPIVRCLARRRAATRQAALATAGACSPTTALPRRCSTRRRAAASPRARRAYGPAPIFPTFDPCIDDVHADDVPWTLSLSTARDPRGTRSRRLCRSAHERGGRSAERIGPRLPTSASGLRPDAIAGEAFRLADGREHASQHRLRHRAQRRHAPLHGPRLRPWCRDVRGRRRPARAGAARASTRFFAPTIPACNCVLQSGTSLLSTTMPRASDAGRLSIRWRRARPCLRPNDPAGRPGPAGDRGECGSEPRRDVTVRVPTGALVNARELEARATRALDDIGTALGTSTVACR